MATPRPMDQSKANPVLYRQKARNNPRPDSSRSATPRAFENRRGTPRKESVNTRESDAESKRQEIVLNIPQQQRDDEDKTEDNSRATSIANLDAIAPEYTKMDTPATDTIDTSPAAPRGASNEVSINNTDVEINQDHNITKEGPNEQSVEIETNQKESNEAPYEEACSGNNNADQETVNMAATESVQENTNKMEAEIPTPRDDGKPVPLLRTDTTITQSAFTEDFEEDFDDRKTVPDVDSEIQAVMLAQRDQQSEIFDLTQSVENVDFELARRNAKAMELGILPPQSQADGHHALSMSDVNGPALRGKTCTPASLYTDVSELKFIGDDRLSQAPETKEAMFQQAISLMGERCVSRDSSRMMAQIDHRYKCPPHAGPSSTAIYSKSLVSADEPAIVALRDDMETPLIGVKHHPYGRHKPEYFYVHQRKPTPMEPLPAWKGYHGNVYFNPINVHAAKPVPHPPTSAPDIDSCSEQLQKILRSRHSVARSGSVASKRTTDTSLVSLSTASNPRSSATSRRSAMKRSQSVASMKSRSSAYSKSSHASRQMSLLDKRAVLNNFNENIEEDMAWIQGMESTGSLTVLKNNIEPPVETSKRPVVHFEKEKIRKGSVLRRTHSAKTSKDTMKKRNYPSLDIKGGQCDQPASNSQAILRARPHYPFINLNRQIVKGPFTSGLLSPESFNSLNSGSVDRLPPLEQLKATLRRMENGASKEELIRMIPPSKRRAQSVDAKRTPFVKFSPEYRIPHPPSRNIIVK